MDSITNDHSSAQVTHNNNNNMSSSSPPPAGETLTESAAGTDSTITDGEIEETPLLSPVPPPRKTVRTKVPEVEVHLYRRGKGPIAVFRSSLGGWDQDQLEVRDILEKYGFKSLFAFNPAAASRGVPIRFSPKKGRSILTYKDGSVLYFDGEPKDSLLNPVTKIVLGVVVITLLITFVLKETPQWMQKFNVFAGNFPPWILACVVIVFTRMRKRTRDWLKNYG